MSAVTGSLYLLAVAVGLSSAYFDGPFERNVNDFRTWRRYWEPIAEQADQGGRLEEIEQAMFERIAPLRKALPVLRCTYFCAAVFSLWRYLAITGSATTSSEAIVARTMVSALVLVAGAYQVLLFFAMKQTRKDKHRFEFDELLPNKPAS